MKKRNMTAGIAFVLVLAMALGGCGRTEQAAYNAKQNYEAGRGSAAYDAAYETAPAADMFMEEMEYDAEEALTGVAASKAVNTAETQAAQTNQKIVWSGYLRIESTEYEKALQEMELLMKRYQVKVESSEEYDGSSWYNGSDSSRVMNWQLRIPSEHFQSFFEDAGEISGQIRTKSTSSSDMTKRYSDTAIQIESLTIQQENLMEMMKKAQSIEDMLAIEDRLAEVRSQLRILTDSNAQIDYDVDWSTISVELQEVHVYQKENITYWQRLQQAAGNSLVEFVEALGDFLVTFLYAIPYLVVLAILIWLGRKVLRNRRRRKLEKKEKAQKQQEQ